MKPTLCSATLVSTRVPAAQVQTHTPRAEVPGNSERRPASPPTPFVLSAQLHSFECKQRHKISIFRSSAQPLGICRGKEANISLSGRIEVKEPLSWLQNWMLPLERTGCFPWRAVVSGPLLSSKVKALTTDLSTSKYSQGFRSVTLCTRQVAGHPSVHRVK